MLKKTTKVSNTVNNTDETSQKTEEQEVPVTNFFTAMVSNGNEIYLMLQEDFAVAAWKSEYDAMQYFEKGYREAHVSSYERSMSACIHMVTFRPVIVHFDSIEEVEEMLEKPMIPATLSNVAGRMNVIACNEKASSKYEKGRTPSLV